MPLFEYASLIAAPVETVFAFHQRPDALELLTPPWAGVRVLRRTGGIGPGAEVELLVPIGPFRKRWLAVHTDFEQDRLFVDEQREGPFRRWVHRHEFYDAGGSTRLVDRVFFSLPGGPPADFAAAWLAKLQLRRMFRYRHEITRRHTEPQARR
jgi:ligand-binding SRPBCC domain-containing protein